MKKNVKREPWQHFQKETKKKKHLSLVIKATVVLLVAGLTAFLVIALKWSITFLNPIFTVSTDFNRLANPFSLFLVSLDEQGNFRQAEFLLLKNEKAILFEIPDNILLPGNEGFFTLKEGIEQRKNWSSGLQSFLGFLPNGYLVAKSVSMGYWFEVLLKDRVFRFFNTAKLMSGQKIYSNLSPLETGKMLWQLPKVSAGEKQDLGSLDVYQKVKREDDSLVLVLEKAKVLDDFIKSKFAKTFPKESLKISALIYNISGAPGLASQAARFLENLEITVLEIANRGPCSKAPFCQNQLIVYKKLPKELLDYLEKVFKTSAIERFGQEGRGEIEVLVGDL